MNLELDSLRKTEWAQINKIRNEKGEATMDTTETQRNIRTVCQENRQPGIMDKFLEKYNLPRLNEGEIDNMNRPNISSVVETVIKKSSNKQKSRTRWLHR